VAIFSQVRTVAGYIGLVCLGVAAIGILIAAIFTTDPATTRGEAATFSGRMHVLGASLDYTPLPRSCLVSAWLATKPGRPTRRRLFITVGVTLVALTAFMFTLPYDGKIGPGVMAGLFGRLLLVSYLGRLITVGLCAINRFKQTAAQLDVEV
jgi:hypothetical protein